MNRLSQRPLFYIIASILASFFISVCVPVSYLSYVPMALLPFLVLFFFPQKKYKTVAKLFVLPAILGAVYFALYSYLFYQPMLRFQDEDIGLEGKIISECKEGANSKYYTVRPDKILYGTKAYKGYGNVIVYFPSDQTGFPVGSKIYADGYAFKDEESTVDYRVTQRNFLTMYARKQTCFSEPSAHDFDVMLSKARDRISDVYEDCFSSDVTAFFKALTLGDKEDLPDEVNFNFKNTGVSHVMAVSGMHLAFLSAILWALLSLVRANLYLRSLIQLIVIWAFTAIVGFSASCMRAAIMLTVYHIGVFINKESDPLTSLSVAVFLCCIFNPYAILNVGLLLSASATFGIITLTPLLLARIPVLYHRKNALRSLLDFLKQTFCMSVAATITTFPILAIVFNSISLLSPITNLLIIFPIEILFGIAFASIILSWCPPIVIALSWIAEVLYRYCTLVTDWLAHLPVSSVYTGNIRFWIYFAVFACFVGFFCLRLKKNRKFPILTVSFAMLWVMVGIQGIFDYSNRDMVNAYFVDVGQGNTTIVVSQNQAVIVDCGGDGDGYRSILTTLQQSGVHTVSAVYLTHMDSDHIKFLPFIMNHYKVGTLYLPKRVEYSDFAEQMKKKAAARTDIHYITKDETTSFRNKLIITALTNQIDFADTESENENSVVYRLVYGNTEILCTGDIENDGEQRLLEYQDQLECDIVEIAHHGSDGGSSEEFLKLTKADLAIISVGMNNKYRLPSLSTLTRIFKYIPQVFRTDLEGTIQISMSPDTYKVKKGY